MKQYRKLLRWLIAGTVFVTPTAAYALDPALFVVPSGGSHAYINDLPYVAIWVDWLGQKGLWA